MTDTPLASTPRLTLRRFTDRCIGDDYLGWLNDAEVTRFSNQRFRQHDAESSRRYLAGFAGAPSHFIAIWLTAEQRMIGTMTAYVSPPHGTADLGLLIGDRACWGRGFGLEAWSALMRKLFDDGLRKITGGTVRPNVGMQTIMERSGMRLEAVRERQEIIEQQEVDVLYYARFRDA